MRTMTFCRFAPALLIQYLPLLNVWRRRDIRLKVDSMLGYEILMTRKHDRLKTIALALLAVLLATVAQSRADITISNPISGPPATPGDGLLADYYKTADPPETIANAQAFIAVNSPTATFISTGVGYPFANPGGTIDDGSSLSTYLGSDAANLSNPVGGNTLDDSIYHFTG